MFQIRAHILPSRLAGLFDVFVALNKVDQAADEKLIARVTTKEGLRFAIRERGRTVGPGGVSMAFAHGLHRERLRSDPGSRVSPDSVGSLHARVQTRTAADCAENGSDPCAKRPAGYGRAIGARYFDAGRHSVAACCAVR